MKAGAKRILLVIGTVLLTACQAPKEEAEYSIRKPIPTSGGLDVAITITEERFMAPPQKTEPTGELPVAVPNWNAPEMRTYKVGPRDTLEVVLYYGTESQKYEVQVQTDGDIILPLIGAINVMDKTPEEIQELLITEFSKYYVAPTVAIKVLDYQAHHVYVVGITGKNFDVILKKRTTILELLNEMGEAVSKVDLRGAYLQRGDKIYPVDLKRLLEGDLNNNYELKDNDVLHVRSLDSMKVFVLGEVVRPGVLKMEVDDHLFWALARAGGPTTRAQLHEVRIIRGGLSNPTLITVDIQVLFKRRPPRQLNTEDLRKLYISAEASRKSSLSLEKLYLQNEDFIYVPRTALAQWNDIIREISPTLSFLVTQPIMIFRDTILLEKAL